MAQSHQIPKPLSNSTFLLDTNFFIDSYSRIEDFEGLVTEFKSNNIVLTSINLVKYEFIRSKTIDVVKKKEKYFNEIVSVVLPFDNQAEQYIVGVIEQYRQFMEGVSLTDLLLASCLKRYRSLYLLTRDRHDFPTTIFDRVYIFNIESVRDIKAYGVYAYGSEEEKKAVNDEIPF